MALLESLQLPLGTLMPSFELKDPENSLHKSEELVGEKGLLIVFTCNHCPYAQAIWERVIKISAQAKKLGIHTVAINPNIHPDYPEDSPAEMAKLIKTLEIDFPYLIDDTQNTAKAFKAQCTPDIYLVDKDYKLVYHGRVDDNWQDEHNVRKHELLSAINALANNLEVPKEQHPCMGCSIKWK